MIVHKRFNPNINFASSKFLLATGKSSTPLLSGFVPGVPSSNPWLHSVNSQLIYQLFTQLLPVRIRNCLSSISNICLFIYSVPISTAVLSTFFMHFGIGTVRVKYLSQEWPQPWPERRPLNMESSMLTLSSVPPSESGEGERVQFEIHLLYA